MRFARRSLLPYVLRFMHQVDTQKFLLDSKGGAWFWIADRLVCNLSSDSQKVLKRKPKLENNQNLTVRDRETFETYRQKETLQFSIALEQKNNDIDTVIDQYFLWTDIGIFQYRDG